ncbi:5-oxoprolinase subunit PxpA [Parvularcula sp. LCG005]|uniref:5-oxoprolinase subunit PxpA n=1 Tax=Parvularcula sp. LCG005 TaxID=3078805 RepID=UPI002943F0CA|nr:5-oxoprolinase subunit PxpA [Parvularcula sp. LCG005]WOI53370.1 5-oxoprolinase subunit PxpA [Parvularcula sp. LCG005]
MTSTLSIDLNADLGEGCGDDTALMPVLSSCNIACGGHAGDQETMAIAVALAQQHGVAIGAHPSYPDRDGFGRRALDIEPAALRASLLEQCRTLMDVGAQRGARIVHLKPHGALYNVAAQDEGQAHTIVAVAQELGLRLVGPPGGEMRRLAGTMGVPYTAEGFADRQYDGDGQLVSRQLDGSVFHEVETQVTQALALARGDRLEPRGGGALSLRVETICVHGDTPGAVDAAKAIRCALENSNISIRSVQ